MAKRPKDAPTATSDEWDALLPSGEEISRFDTRVLPPADGWTLREAWTAFFPELNDIDGVAEDRDHWRRASVTLLRFIVNERPDLTFAGVPVAHDKDMNAAPIVIRRNVIDAYDRAPGTWPNISIYDGTFDHGPFGGKPPRVMLSAVRVVAAEAPSQPPMTSVLQQPSAVALPSPPAADANALHEGGAADEESPRFDHAEDDGRSRARGRPPNDLWTVFDAELVRLARLGVFQDHRQVIAAMKTWTANKHPGWKLHPDSIRKRVASRWLDSVASLDFWRDFDSKVVQLVRNSPDARIGALQREMRLWASKRIEKAGKLDEVYRSLVAYSDEAANERVQNLCVPPED